MSNTKNTGNTGNTGNTRNTRTKFNTKEIEIFKERLFSEINEKYKNCAEFARENGMYPVELSDIRHDRRIPTLPKLVKLSKALGVNIDYLLGTADLKHTPKDQYISVEYFSPNFKKISERRMLSSLDIDMKAKGALCLDSVVRYKRDRLPSYDKLISIIKVLNVSVTDLLTPLN